MFGYLDLLKEIDKFALFGAEVGEIGVSAMGQRIPYIFVGKKNAPCMIVQGGIHAREHITSLLVVQQAKYLLKNKDLVNSGGIYFVPMTNPDGVRLATENLSWIENKKLKTRLVEINGKNTDFSLWKANIRGVDLNVNFDAKWARGKQNVFFPSPDNYVGKAPGSEIETQNLMKFTALVKPCVTVSYHIKGELIFWRFMQGKEDLWRDYKYAKMLRSITGYRLNDGAGSVGGYKDYCISKLHIPSYTIEAGNDSFGYPYPYDDFENIFAKNCDVPRQLLNSVVTDLNRETEKKQRNTVEEDN